jgi:predicted transcriptional regulator
MSQKQKSETMSLRLRPEEKQQLEELARRADRSAGWVLRELVRAASESRRVEVTAAGVVVK